jgi:hypothetical protein
MNSLCSEDYPDEPVILCPSTGGPVDAKNQQELKIFVWNGAANRKGVKEFFWVSQLSFAATELLTHWAGSSGGQRLYYRSSVAGVMPPGRPAKAPMPTHHRFEILAKTSFMTRISVNGYRRDLVPSIPICRRSALAGAMQKP